MPIRADSDLSGFFRNSYFRISVPLGPSTDKLNRVDVVETGVKKQMSSIMLVRPERDRVVDQKSPDGREQHRFPPAVSVAIAWTGAALGVYAVEFGARGLFAGVSRPVVALAKVAVILIAGAVYARSARGAPSGFVLASGEYQLLGDPRVISAILRDATIFAWLGAPAFFARGGAPIEREEDAGRYP